MGAVVNIWIFDFTPMIFVSKPIISVRVDSTAFRNAEAERSFEKAAESAFAMRTDRPLVTMIQRPTVESVDVRTTSATSKEHIEKVTLRNKWESIPYEPKPILDLITYSEEEMEKIKEHRKIPRIRPIEEMDTDRRFLFDPFDYWHDVMVTHQPFTPPPCKRELCESYPHFLIIGARKCSTGALRTFLSLHPELVTPGDVEEVSFFRLSYFYERGDISYWARMPPSSRTQLTFEKSIYFDPAKDSPRRIRLFCDTYNKTMKFILLVRHPVVRMISDFHRLYQNENVSSSEVESKIISEFVDNKKLKTYDLEYFGEGDYYTEMKRWLRFFHREQFLILDGSELIRNPVGILQRVESFLGVRHRLTKEVFFYNKRKGFYCYHNAGQRQCLPSNKGRPHAQLPKWLTLKLIKYFKPLAKQFFSLTGVNFDWSETERDLINNSY